MKELKSTDFTCICGSKISNVKTLQKHLRRQHNHLPERSKTDLIKDLSNRIRKENEQKLELAKKVIKDSKTHEEKIKVNTNIEEYKTALLPILYSFSVPENLIVKVLDLNSLSKIKSLIVNNLNIEVRQNLELRGFDLNLLSKQKRAKVPKPKATNPKKKSKKNEIAKSVRLIYTPMGNKR